MKIERVPIGLVVPWNKNPRGILKTDFARLKRQIKRLGVYKPLVVCRDGLKKGQPRYISLGGNMRLLALRELGAKEVDVSIVEAKTEREKIEFSLSDNDRAGYYEEEKVAELVYPYMGEIKLGEIKVDLGTSISLEKICRGLGPGGDNAGFDEELEKGKNLNCTLILINIPKRFKTKVEEFLANGEPKNPVGFGNGILKRCGLL